jgi:cytochrome P450
MSAPVDEFDHLDTAVRDPADAFTELRGACPVSRSGAHGGFSVLAGYRDIRAAAQDPEVFSSRSISIPDRPGSFDPITLDPPDHERSRSILAPFFSPRRVEQRESAIRALTAARLDDIVELGACDISLSVTRIVVTRTLFELLGIPRADHAKVSTWIDVLIFDEVSTRAEGQDAVDALHRYLYLLVLSPGAGSRGDETVIGRLVGTRIEGRALGADAIVNVVTTLLYGAIGPSTFLINGALARLDQDHALRRRLLDDPALLATATEEFLRIISPVRSIGRIVTRPDRRFDHDFVEGERVLLIWGAANRDPGEFPSPDDFIADRAPNRHVAFGAGIHRCLGAHLARLELRVVLGEVLRRLPDYRLDATADLGWQTGHMCGINRLPITYGDATPVP